MKSLGWLSGSIITLGFIISIPAQSACPNLSGKYQSRIWEKKKIAVEDAPALNRLAIHSEPLFSGDHGETDELITDGKTPLYCQDGNGDILCRNVAGYEGHWIFRRAENGCEALGLFYVTRNGSLRPGQPPLAYTSIGAEAGGGLSIRFSRDPKCASCQGQLDQYEKTPR